MYLAAIVLLMLVLPVGSVLVEGLTQASAGWLVLIGKWFVFWAVGVRLLLAGLMQTLRPQFTAERIFDVQAPAAHDMVREIGFGNIAMGTIGALSLWLSGWLLPAAVAGGLYYGLAGLGHVARGGGNAMERVAMVSDFFIFAVLALFVAWRAFGGV